MDLRNQFGAAAHGEFVDARRYPRYKLDIALRIYPRNASVIRGHSVDISESGISAMMTVEVPVGELVRLEFDLPHGAVEVHATVRQRVAFRYGFQFVESGSSQEIISRTCRYLALEQSLYDGGRATNPQNS